ncbi:inositol monophosphatase [Alkalihalobacillus sp. LMS39]|uniref:inositol monophosphatase family protein n=1 Tax=Alkalihalobacillus sp. LMS39 TaxID=2924032 RepID=UPI001FB21968|nr:inositol monophosphatase [Alkalihalobacillus sp. LMS39]UOE92989.1 inositol monophosphatase [Alkalihalobacillus sp. LMS39]
MDWSELEQQAIQWVKEAGIQLKDSLEKTIKVEWKSNPDDLVTEMDRNIEQFFVQKIKDKYPEHAILGEEGTSEGIQEEGTVWIIDPIDGTTNFVHQQYNFAISIGVYHNGIGQVGLIYNVMTDELFHAVLGTGAFLNGVQLNRLTPVNIEESIVSLNARWLVEGDKTIQNHLSTLTKKVRGVRSYGSAAIEIAYVASGRLDGYISLKLSPWDFAGGFVILQEVGGVHSTIRGQAIHYLQTDSVFVGRPGLHQAILDNIFL